MCAKAKFKRVATALDKQRILAVQDVVAKAFSDLVSQWMAQERKLVSYIEVMCCQDGRVRCRGDVEEPQPLCTQMRFWSMRESAEGAVACLNHGVRFPVEERIIRVFTILTESLLVVSVGMDHTIIQVLHPKKHRQGFKVVAIKTLGKIASTSAFDASERVLLIASDSGYCSLYRVDERYRTMEAVATFDLTTKTTLEMPLRCATLVKSMVHLVDRDGAIQSLNTRNLQCSRQIGVMPPGSSRRFSLCDGQVLGRLDADSI